MLLELLLIISLVGASYSYFLYPVLLVLFKKIGIKAKTQINSESTQTPFVSFIITAYNEEKSIAQKIENTLACEYPQQQLEILVASDGSTDMTNAIVKEFSDQGVRLIEVTERLGKENAQRQAIDAAKGDIIVFSDVSTRIEPHAIQRIVEVFNDQSIGAISSEDRFLSQDGKVVGEGAYVKYEMWLRNLESHINSLVGLSGSFFAARKSICTPWDISVPSDFNTALNSVSHGYRAVSDPELLGFYPDIKSGGKEYQRKLRTVIRGLAALFSKTQVLNPFKFGLFSFQIFSHKLMRWAVPWFLISSFVLNALLLGHGVIFQLIFLGQVLFYVTALVGWLFTRSQSNTLVKLCFFFIQVNLAIFHATLLFIRGKRITKWEPSKR